MQMTIFDIPARQAKGMNDKLCKILDQNTVFGAGRDIDIRVEKAILDDDRFNLPLIRKLNLKHLASKQLGTSGGGNHFVEFGIVEMETGPEVGMDEPRLAVLSHSGSRGVGYKIAMAYSDLAMEVCPLPGDAKRLAWFDMSSEIGQEYWQAMELAGEFAKACHDIIHDRILRALGTKTVNFFENHHNFAWKETVDGEEVIVHRKGATPAGKGVTGLIPGSMTTPTFVVSGLGNHDSINSSSHGAGRAMSRKAAKEKFTLHQMKDNLLQAGVILIGGSVDECSMAYKDIQGVMHEQRNLVEIIGKFKPVIVKMAEGETKPWEKGEGE
jgi:tRNA-splicing ligase RtcB